MSETEVEPQTEPDAPDTEEDDAPDTETEPEGRCEAETEAGGTAYRCALDAEHDGEHKFSPVDADDTGAEDNQAASDAAMLDANKKVARAAQTYWNKVREQYGDDLGGFHSCPLCVGYPPGLYWPSELPPEKSAALRTVLGMPALENYEYDRRYFKCATCNGKGHVRTPSDVPAEMVKPCIDCGQRGWVPGDEKIKVVERAPILDAPSNGGEDVASEPPPFDPWGRPFGDPDYYRMPIAGVTT